MPKRLAPLAVLTAGCFLVPAAAAQADDVIVQPGAGVAGAALERVLGSADVVSGIYGTNALVVRTSGTGSRLISRLEQSGLVRYAEPDRTLRTQATPNDPRFAELYGLQRIDAPRAWDALGIGSFPATGGPKVGIVDTGIRGTHQDLAGKVVDCADASGGLLGGIGLGGGSIREGRCNDGNGHGTHVAGTIAARANDARGVAGVAFTTSLSICKGLSDSGSGSTSGIASCIRWLADRGTKVISMSLGGGGTQSLQDAVRYAYRGGAGALVVAAAGNDGDGTLNYPAAYDEVVSVAATDSGDRRASFSNANADVEVAAPGVGILSTWSTADDAYNSISGTSMATPHAAGVAALIAQRLPSATAGELRSRLDAATTDLGASGRDPEYGFGLVDALQAVTE